MLPFAKKTYLKRLIHRTLWVRVDHVLYIYVHMIYGYTLLVPIIQRMLNKLNKAHNTIGHLRDSRLTECSNFTEVRWG